MATPDCSRMNLIVSLFLDEYEALDAKGTCPVEVLYHVGFSGRTGSLTVPMSGRTMAMAVYSGWIEPFAIIDRVSRDVLLRVMCPSAGDPKVTEVAWPAAIDLLEDLTNEYAEERLIAADRLPGFGDTPLFEIPDSLLSPAQREKLGRPPRRRGLDITGQGFDAEGNFIGKEDVVEMGWDTY